ncbi:transglycosylase SLT domain-containing protein [Streptomyces marispadix]|uniref:Transglycosylase SLT domain-containing protein n=1 Tax=Streptomyces marispadix TaxID=2922868 RepID=A0ABS9SUE4_9ACTN|nr:transglycosylase SLT domain-containing protein [Streptomyces marispadix]MCH6159808.1 transglycosylase SLT domain-containing protein [Streptomyces marispadix]
MPNIPGYVRSPKFARFSAAGISAAGAAAIALTVLPGTADAGDQSQSGAKKVSASTAAAESTKESQAPKVELAGAKQGTLDADVHRAGEVVAAQKEAVAQQKAVAADRAEAAKAQAAKRAEAEKKAEAARKAAADRKAEAKARAARSAERPAAKTYPDNLDGWIREARSIMAKHGIPGSYDGIKRNIIRESGGDPNAVNDWDINAQKGTPSKGLLQTIQPTFDAYHVDGTSTDITDPVANIVAACNYAADKYGSMDNVDSAY